MQVVDFTPLNSIYHWLVKNFLLWIRPVIVFSVLFLSAALAYIAPEIALMLVPVLIIGVITTLLFLNYPILGFLALIGSIVIFIDGPSGSNATAAIAGLLFALWMFDLIFRKRQIRFINSITIRPLMLFVLITVISFVAGQLPWYTFITPAKMGAQIAGLGIHLLSAIVFLLVAHQIKDIRRLEWMVWLFLAISAIHIVGRIIPPLDSLTVSVFRPGVTGSLFWTWGVALAASQALFNTKLNIIIRGALGLLTVMILYVGVFKLREWNSGWTPSLIAVVALIWVAKPKLGTLFGAIGVVLILIKMQDLIGAVMVGDNDYSLGTRVDAWLIVFNIVKVNPILGLGPSSYRAYTPLFPIRGYAVEFNSHSQYVDIIAQTGILGLITFLWFFIAIGWVGWRLRNRVPAGFPQAYVYGALGGLAGTMVAAVFGDWVIPFFYNIGLTGFRASMLGWLFLGGLIAIDQMYPKNNEEVSEEVN